MYCFESRASKSNEFSLRAFAQRWRVSKADEAKVMSDVLTRITEEGEAFLRDVDTPAGLVSPVRQLPFHEDNPHPREVIAYAYVFMDETPRALRALDDLASPDVALPRLAAGLPLTLWEGKDIATGTVASVRAA